MDAELTALAAEFDHASRNVPAETRKVVSKGALNVKNEAKQNVRKSAPIHSSRAEQFINYDVEVDGDTVEAEIGYDKSFRPARLGNLLEFGSPTSAPHRDIGRALDDEEPRFVAAMADIAEGLMK